MLQITFCGAARTVTGSMYYFEYNGPNNDTFRFCVDSGMFQTGSSLSLFKTNSHLLFDPKLLDCVLLTHAHLDHCGRLPYLVKQGFGGKIYSTAATKEIAEVVMRDAAHLSTADPDKGQYYFNQKGLEKADLEGRGVDADQESNEEIPLDGIRENLGLYNEDDVDTTVNRFINHEYHKPFTIHPNLEVEFYDAGHILGSSYIVLTEISSDQKIVFSGDLGNRNKPILHDPELPKKLDDITHIFVETTYGNRLHGKQEPKQKLRDICFATLSGQGQVIIPSFSVERAQEIIYYLVELMRDNKLPQVPIFLDSPMASKVLKIMLSHPELYDSAMLGNIEDNQHPLVYTKLKILESSDDSKTLNGFEEPCIIIAGSGMLNGGRIIKHLKFHVQNAKNTLIIVGYQAEGTLGRRILDGEKHIVIEGNEYEVAIKVEKINEFSAHADQIILRDWLSSLLINQNNQLKPTVFLTHGEKVGAEGLQAELQKSYGDRITTYWPYFGEKLTLWN